MTPAQRKRKAKLIALVEAEAARRAVRHGTDPTPALRAAWEMPAEAVPEDVESAAQTLLALTLDPQPWLPRPDWLRAYTEGPDDHA